MSRTGIGPGPLIGHAAKTLRLQARLSLRDVARPAGISPAYLLKLEEGEVANPGIGVVMALAETLGTTVAELIGEAPGTNIRNAEVEVQLRGALRKLGRLALAAASGSEP